MWTEVGDNERKQIVSVLKDSYRSKTRFAGIFLCVPFIIGLLVSVVCLISGELAKGDAIPGMIACCIIIALILFFFFRVKFPFDVDHIYISEPMQVEKIYRHNHHRSSASLIVVECNGFIARKIVPLEVGDTCRFLHCGNIRLNEAYEMDCRFAINDKWLLNVYK